MTAKYKHFDIVVAWMNGAEVQVKDKDRWLDFEPGQPRSVVPTFAVSEEYRIKPKTITVNLKPYRRAVFTDGLKIYSSYYCYSETAASLWEKSSGFVKWLDEGWVTEATTIEQKE